ncbi:MAG: LON peptidase substrate-binding domain-containing protein [Verrucomicrobiales bacterium]|nr:LON peptidase substrate-binding domain-containing protein [Verrucomicrobiales bacterium]
MPESEAVRIPDHAPVMVLGGATLFPHGYMPLFIFEQRYRDMLTYALERQRMFCIGHALPNVDTDDHPDPVHRITTIGLIRACVTHPDGTSHLMLSGLQRVEILGWEQTAPFRIATIVPQACHIDDPAVVRHLALEVVDLCGRLCGDGKPMTAQLRDHLKGIHDPSAIADVVAQSFLNDPCDRQRILEILSVEDRLRYLSRHLSQLLVDS